MLSLSSPSLDVSLGLLDATELCEEMILGRGELIGLMSRVVHVALDLVLFGPEPTLGHDLFEDLTFADIVVEVMPVARRLPVTTASIRVIVFAV